MAVASWHLLTLGPLVQGLGMVVMVVVMDHHVVTTISCHFLKSIGQLLPILQVVLVPQKFLNDVRVLAFIPMIVALPEIRTL